VVNLSGGAIGERLSAIAGSEFHLFGSSFLLDGVAIANLVAGQMFVISDRDVTLSGRLADGSTFSFRLDSNTFGWPDYFDSNALLTVTSILYGDYNGNGAVDMGDYVVWRNSFGSTTNLAADGNRNGLIDQADYSFWKSRFGATTGGNMLPVAGRAPEPATLGHLLVAITVAGHLLRWRIGDSNSSRVARLRARST
jgi:hypothetical protein